ncbi:hypothetical protein TIFTF001_036449 [Ficus carica]|uniref:Uncharacterized protein n=1 Tax=Ficus carica TaxID=3494 RepID=A0AA88JAR3_FICCA|nr:hypothetical protein TIFTF001_036449 [Ficus carica]
MANPRRSSYSLNINTNINQSSGSASSENPLSLFHYQSSSSSSRVTLCYLSLLHFLKKPHAFPFLLSVFLLLTWLFLRIQRSPHFSADSSRLRHSHRQRSQFDDSQANPRRFTSAFPSLIANDKRGGCSTPFLVPLILAFWIDDLRTPNLAELNLLAEKTDFFPFAGVAETCVSVHFREIRPRGILGNHRHYSCNETFVIWGAKTLFRRGYAEVIIGADEVAVAASPSGTAHAIVNMDPVRSKYSNPVTWSLALWNAYMFC